MSIPTDCPSNTITVLVLAGTAALLLAATVLTVGGASGSVL